MAIIHVTEATGGLPNSGRLSGTDGDMVGIQDVALLLNGWAIEATNSTDRVYRPGTGNRFRVGMRDAAAVSGAATLTMVRGMENFVSASSWTDPFPTVARIADGSSNWLKSSAANTTARNFDIYVGTTWVLMFVNFAGTTNVWEMQGFWDIPPTLSGDTYNTAICTRNSTSFASTSNNWVTTSVAAGNLSYALARTYDGTLKSPTGGPVSQSNTTFGAIQNSPQAQLGPTTGLDRVKVPFTDAGSTTATPSTTLSLPQRGFVPNLWAPLHGGRGSINTRDTFTYTAYNPSATFRCFCIGNNTTSGFVIVEETDTWSPP